MAGLVPAINVFKLSTKLGVDARRQAGTGSYRRQKIAAQKEIDYA